MARVRHRVIWSTTFLTGIAGLSSGTLLFPTGALANCTTTGGVTTCDTTSPNPYTTRVGTGQSDNNRTVTVNTGATINTTNNNAISLGDNANITINGTVSNTANTPNGGGTAGTGNNTVEFKSNSTLTINSGGSIIASGTSTNSEAINPTGFGNTILNYGLIQATNSAAIWFEDRVTGVPNVVDNYGTIQRVGGGAVMGSSGSSGITFYNRTGAQILGNLSFSAGNDNLIFEAGSTASGGINGGGGTNNLTLQGAAGSNDTLPGNITNFSTLTKDGLGQWTVSGSLSGFTVVTVKDGVLALTGNNAGYTGNLVVNPAGILEARAQSLPTKTPAAANVNNVQNDGLVRFTQTDDGSYSGQITGAGSVVKLGAGVLTLTPVAPAGNTFLGGLSINEGTVAVAADNALGDPSGGLTFNGGTLRLNSSFDPNTGRAITLNAPGGTIDTQAFQSTIGQGITGAGSLTKAGTGTLVLNGANTYSGGTAINGGTLQVSSDGNLGAANGGLTFNGGTLRLGASFDPNTGRAITLNAPGGTIDTQGFQSTIGQAITGAGALTKAGTGTLTLTGANNYSGGTTISAGTLQLGNGGTSGSITGNVANNGTLAFNRSDNVTFGNTISGTGAVQQIGSGITTLTGTNSYTGTTTVAAGTLIVNGDQTAATGATTVNTGATIGGTGIIGGDVTVADGATLAPGNVGTVPGMLTVKGALNLNQTSNLNYNFGQADVVGGAFNDLTTVGGNLTLDGKLNVNLTPGGSFDAGIYRVISYNGTLTDNTLDIASLPPGTPPNTFFVQTSVANQVNLVNTAGLQLNFWDGDAGPKNNGAVNGGNGTWQNAGGLDNWTDQPGTVNAPWNDSAFAIFMATPGTVTVDNGNGAVRASGMQFASDGYVIQGGVLTLVGSPTSTIRVGDGTAAGAGYTATIDSVLDGSTQLVKTDLGTLILNGANTYIGGTAINGGTLQVSSDGNLGAAAGGLTFNGGTLRLGAGFDPNTGRAITLNTPGGTIDTQGFQSTIGQGITGAGALTKAGTGTLILTGASNYSGGTTISAGTLQIGNGGNSGSITGNVTNNATLAFNRADTATFAGVISGTGAVQQIGTGVTTLTGASTYTGPTTVAAGTLAAGAANIFSSASAFSVLPGGTLALQDFDQTLASLSNAGTINLGGTKTGTTLTVAGNYLGNGGTVQLATQLGGDTSPTDKLMINGDSTGSSLLKVVNAGGLGAPTAEGIKVVQVDGASSGKFSLIGDFTFKGSPSIVAGAYAYRLFQGGTSTPADGDWYLRSQLKQTPLPPEPPEPPEPQYNPGVPVYEAYAQHLLAMNGLPTLQQRVGNRYWSDAGANVVAQGADAPAENPAPDGVNPTYIENRAFWGRIEGLSSSIEPAVSTSGTSYDQNIFRMQAGLDLLLAESEAGRLLGGVTLHYVHGKTVATAPSGDGSISSDGYGFGGTLTWYGNDGFYVDGQAQATWYSSDLTSITAGRSLASGNDGFGYALSMETGKRFLIGDDLTLTPQAQLVYSRVNFDSFVDPFGAGVSMQDGDSLRGRLGLSLDRENSWTGENGTLTRSHVYGITNLHYEFLQGTRVDVASVDFSNRSDRLWGEIGFGGSYNWNDDKYSIYGEGSVATSLAHFGDSNTVKGSLGFRVKW